MSTYRDAEMFRMAVWLPGKNPYSERRNDGPAAEREAFEILKATVQERNKSTDGAAMAHIEWQTADGKWSTYSRINRSEWHTVRLYADPDSPTGKRYTCSCGAKRYTVEEQHDHHRNVGRCTSCWGQEELRPVVDGEPDVSSWVDCPSCQYGDARDGAPALDETLYAHPATLLRAYPVAEDHTF